MNKKNSIADIRKVYQLGSLLEKDVVADPVKQFEKWWQHAIESKIEEPNAMTLATATTLGKPSARIVLLKGIKENGFVFFTNYQSRKGREIEENPFVSLLFFWKALERQVRVEGKIKRTSVAESDEYFFSRPKESRIGAWSSQQSSVIKDRKLLQENVEKYNRQFETENIPRPPHWGGFIVEPYCMEFWQGRPGRLHDRLQYVLENNEWVIRRLAP
ncbi:MAG: pyridoxamine 5'-phosphate oxidase [Ginsengibacter sp.]